MTDAADALKARQGPGARHDAPEAPAQALLLARRGAAFFARVLDGLADGALDGASLRAGVSRRALIAEIGYDTRDLANRFEALRLGAPPPKLPDRARRIALGASMPAHALRHLVQHTQVHLNVAWRDLPGAMWAMELPGAPALCAAETPLMQASALWHGALALGAGGRLADVPAALR